MQLIEAVLAFAITMLVLSLIVSSFVEIIHRTLSMREAGLKYMLYQVFDQVLAKYISPALDAIAKTPASGKTTAELLEQTRKSFVERMSANRAPITFPVTAIVDSAAAVPAAAAAAGGTPAAQVDLAALTSAQFMERLGSIDVGSGVNVAEILKKANEKANAAAAAAGGTAANAVDAVLVDIAQKFEAFGRDAGTFFESRARWLSVFVAVVLAFAIRVDAIELFNTYLRDPNARNSVIAQMQAVTAQYKAVKESAGDSPSDDVKAQLETLKKDWLATVDSTRNTVKQYSDLGLPIGWTKQNATLNPWAVTCSKDGVLRIAADKQCGAGEKPDDWAWFRLAWSLLLGGILVGLGAPFWYSAVTGLTNIRSIAKDVVGGEPKVAAPGAAAVAPTTPDLPQPTTPVGAFNVSQAAKAAAVT
ncbi:MAG: hypothetical protein ABIL01_17370 [Pseudomonadota bacterium]